MASLLSYIPIFEYFTSQVCLHVCFRSAYLFVYAQRESFAIRSFMHSVNPSPQHGAQVRILRSYGVRREAGDAYPSHCLYHIQLIRSLSIH